MILWNNNIVKQVQSYNSIFLPLRIKCLCESRDVAYYFIFRAYCLHNKVPKNTRRTFLWENMYTCWSPCSVQKLTFRWILVQEQWPIFPLITNYYISVTIPKVETHSTMSQTIYLVYRHLHDFSILINRFLHALLS